MLVLVTGGTGFLGSKVAEKILALKGDFKLRILSRRALPGCEEKGVEVAIGDLRDFSSLKKATEGVNAVIHTAAKAGIWGDPEEYKEINQEGARKLLIAAEENGARYFIHTSTASVVYQGKDLLGVDESAPYDENFPDPYPVTKVFAEKLILSKNSDYFKTLSLRPHIIWGPGDPHFVPRILERARKGKLRLFKGGPYIFDSIYVDNAADAHVEALLKLIQGAPVDGRAYFIAQNEPLDSRDFINRVLAAANLPKATPTLSPKLGLAGARVIEFFWKLFNIKKEPPVTVFSALNLTTSHYFNLERSKKLLGFVPKVSLDEGFERLKAFLNP
jgi:nucleoside-diphosphate-sugar epimerase